MAIDWSKNEMKFNIWILSSNYGKMIGYRIFDRWITVNSLLTNPLEREREREGSTKKRENEYICLHLRRWSIKTCYSCQKGIPSTCNTL